MKSSFEIIPEILIKTQRHPSSGSFLIWKSILTAKKIFWNVLIGRNFRNCSKFVYFYCAFFRGSDILRIISSGKFWPGHAFLFQKHFILLWEHNFIDLHKNLDFENIYYEKFQKKFIQKKAQRMINPRSEGSCR